MPKMADYPYDGPGDANPFDTGGWDNEEGGREEEARAFNWDLSVFESDTKRPRQISETDSSSWGTSSLAASGDEYPSFESSFGEDDPFGDSFLVPLPETSWGTDSPIQSNLLMDSSSPPPNRPYLGSTLSPLW